MLAGLRLILDPYCPVPEQIRFPRKGPYWKRRQKKMAAEARNWSKPEFYFTGDAVICHPSLKDLVLKELGCGG